MIPVQGPLVEAVKAFIKCAYGLGGFPAAHPVSIERKHMPLLKQKQYVVCEKTDGTRFLLVCLEFEGRKYAVFVNRKLDMFTSQLAMPKDTILDGELCGNEFYVFDAVAVAGDRVSEFTYLERLKRAEIATKGPKFGIHLKMKTMWPSNAAAEVYRGHPECDGLIFTPVNEPVRTETHETMFKWKPLERITVDFKTHQGNYCIWDSGKLVKVQEAKGVKEGMVVECEWKGMWVPVKYREDKDTPNNRRTMMRTMVNIRENILVTEFNG
jgi:hypothetical protein